MPNPPGEQNSNFPTTNAQLPSQPLPTPQQPTKPSASATKKPRQRKLADTKSPSRRPAPADKSPTQASAPQPSPVTAPRGHVLQPFPTPTYHIMNPPPGYPINGSPFSPQAQHHPGFPAQPSAAPVSAGGPGIPGHPPQYAYPMHPGTYAPPGYAPYHQYPQPVMMYAAPRPSVPPDTPQPAPSPAPQSAAAAGTKRKRKSVSEAAGSKAGEKASDEETGASAADQSRSQAAHQHVATAQALIDLKKRTKTQRACDSCRSRKIRCDILADADPPICQHCKQYGFECTFFLPITETRFKKKKLEEEAAEKDKQDSGKAATSPSVEAKRDVAVFGPTSATHLLHSQASISSRIYEGYDLRYHHKFEISKSGDGLIQVQKPANEEQQMAPPKPIDLRIEREVVEQLINAYFTDVAPLLPAVTQAEFLANSSPPPLLLYSMCLVAAARREVPQSVFDSIRYAVNNVIKAEDVLSTASIVNVQALLILCMTGDSHSQFVPSALSALWIRLGTAIRMAQDLGLHRAESVKQNIELRRRVWGACVISDRWTSLTYGHPYMIDVQDCDARLPSSGDPNDLYMDELVRLSVILGRVLKTIYSPSGLSSTSDDMLHQILHDMDAWKENLPESLKYRGPDTPRNAGLLHLFYACVCMLFWRVFMRISYSCPAHLKFGLTVERWSSLVTLTGEAIDWLDVHERVYDVWLLVAYAATSCALVQYHTWTRRRDEEAAAKLRKLRDCVRRWEGSLSPDHMSARRKTAEIISLLYEATQGPPLPIEAPALNPTGGVKGKKQLGGLVYEKDHSRPGGGVFVAHGEARKGDYDDVASGTIILGSSDSASEDEAPPETQSAPSAPSAEYDSSLLSSSPFAPPLSKDQSSLNVQHRGAASNTPQSIPGPVTTHLAAGAGKTINATASSRLVNFTPLESGRGGSDLNVNPAMNTVSAPGNVHVMNVLDEPQASSTLADFAKVDTGFLEGIPGGMFDWGQWDAYFTRLNVSVANSGLSNTITNFQ